MSGPSPPPRRQWLASEGGAVPFRRFMEAALYDPAFGYYTTRIRTVGAGGDFSTSATLSPRLARAIAAWIVKEAPPQCRHLVEVGPGNGMLHASLREALGWRGRWHWHSHLVERSPALREEQRRRLGRPGGRITWHDCPAEALAAAGGAAMIFSNELVDAFPVTLLQQEGGTWQEVWLELLPDGRLVETLRPVVAPRTSLRAEDFPAGQRVEVHEAWQDWLAEWRPQWRQGTMLTIDYGGLADRVYNRRPHGTMRGYRQHQVLRGPVLYQEFGRCALTADVNFSDLIHYGNLGGLVTRDLMTQETFLSRYSREASAADARLADGQGAGGAFQCLFQQPRDK